MFKVSSVILLMVAGVCFGQQLQQRADDNIVVVGNQALPVQWTHQGTIQGAIKQAGPKGVVMIPATYAGTDCNPLSVCNPGTTLLIDLRGGVFQTYPPLASAGNGAGSSGVAPFVVPGTSMVGFIPDQYCAVNGGSSLDYFCDLNGALVFNAFGYLEVVPLTDRVQTWPAVQTFAAGVATGGPVTQSAAKTIAGTCLMSSATSCTFTISAVYSTPLCIGATPQGTTAIAGACSVSGSTVTITAASSNSQTWGAMIVGNPN